MFVCFDMQRLPENSRRCIKSGARHELICIAQLRETIDAGMAFVSLDVYIHKNIHCFGYFMGGADGGFILGI